MDQYGQLVCGPGYCVKDLHGDIYCSSAARGAASVDISGNPVCSDNCMRASTSLCVKPKASGSGS